MITSLNHLNKIICQSIFLNRHTLPSSLYAALKSYNGVDWNSLDFKQYNIYDNYTEAHLFTKKTKKYYRYFPKETDESLKFGIDNSVNINDSNSDLLIKVIKWSPNYQGIFHHHTGYNCYYKLLYGTLRESVKHTNNNMITDSIHKLHSIGYITDNIGSHKIKNLSDDYTYSLHVYFKTDN